MLSLRQCVKACTDQWRFTRRFTRERKVSLRSSPSPRLQLRAYVFVCVLCFLFKMYCTHVCLLSRVTNRRQRTFLCPTFLKRIYTTLTTTMKKLWCWSETHTSSKSQVVLFPLTQACRCLITHCRTTQSNTAQGRLWCRKKYHVVMTSGKKLTCFPTGDDTCNTESPGNISSTCSSWTWSAFPEFSQPFLNVTYSHSGIHTQKAVFYFSLSPHSANLRLQKK